MCGICGYINFEKENKAGPDIIRSMTKTLLHRGPDEEGYYLKENVGFGFRRLCIIDLKTGQQPMFNENKDIAVIFNGEIYNFIKLREKLIHRHKFCTNSDTEVLVHLYEEYGEDMLEYLNGMFAFALWDNKKRILFCARDRMGQKPFYYFHNHNLFLGELNHFALPH